jgi:hypothetical protein
MCRFIFNFELSSIVFYSVSIGVRTIYLFFSFNSYQYIPSTFKIWIWQNEDNFKYNLCSYKFDFICRLRRNKQVLAPLRWCLWTKIVSKFICRRRHANSSTTNSKTQNGWAFDFVFFRWNQYFLKRWWTAICMIS